MRLIHDVAPAGDALPEQPQRPQQTDALELRDLERVLQRLPPEQREVLRALARSAGFTSAAAPFRVFPPLFNRYEGGGEFGLHVDNAIRQQRGGPPSLAT